MDRDNGQAVSEKSDRAAGHTIHIRSRAAKNRKEIGRKACETVREKPRRLKQSA